MEPLVFSMMGDPRGKGRPRATARGGFARVYTDEKTRAYERSVKALAVAAMRGRKPFTGALSLSLRFRLRVPKSMTKRQRAAVLAGEQPYLGAFDVDNLVKAVADGMNGAVFEDDKQIVRLFATKIGSASPGVDVRVEPLEPQETAA